MRLRHIVRGIALALSVDALCFAASAVPRLAGPAQRLRPSRARSKKSSGRMRRKDGRPRPCRRDARLRGSPGARSAARARHDPGCTNHWTQLSADDQKEFINLYAARAKKVRENAQKTDFDVTYRAGEAGNGLNKVKTEAKDKDEAARSADAAGRLPRQGRQHVQSHRPRHRKAPSSRRTTATSPHKILTTDGQGVPPEAEAEGPHRSRSPARGDDHFDADGALADEDGLPSFRPPPRAACRTH